MDALISSLLMNFNYVNPNGFIGQNSRGILGFRTFFILLFLWILLSLLKILITRKNISKTDIENK